MSDAIVLDVAEQPTIALDVGTADPVARDEIAELAERMDAIEADGSVTTAKLADGAVTIPKLNGATYMSTAQVLALYAMDE